MPRYWVVPRVREQGKRLDHVAWIWSRYRAYRMQAGVDAEDTTEIEAFLRWVEGRADGEGTSASGGRDGSDL